MQINVIDFPNNTLLIGLTFIKWLNCLCGYDSSSTVAAGWQCVSTPSLPSTYPLSLSRSHSLYLSRSLWYPPSAVCKTSHLYTVTSRTAFICQVTTMQIIHRTGGLIIKQYGESVAFCFSSFSATFQTMAITSLSCGRFLCKRSGTKWQWDLLLLLFDFWALKSHHVVYPPSFRYIRVYNAYVIRASPLQTFKC